MIQWYLKRRRLLSIRSETPRGTDDGGSRAGWIVNGAPLWFETRDAGLIAAPEAIACLAFAASALRKWRVTLPEPVCPVLAGNLGELGTIWHGWWDTETRRFRTKSRAAPLSPAPGAGNACFLSLGADSFHSAISDPEVDTVIYVAGYDVPLADTARLENIERHFRAAAAELGKRAIFLRSNLRAHPQLGRLHWERAHGAALAAAAHVLGNSVRNVSISSSFPIHLFKPWGTSWKTDHLWSSGAVSLRHTGQEISRFQKMARIVSHPTFQAHLHVCWEHRNSRSNCGACEKCRRTMIGLLSLGRLADFKTLPDETHLAESLRTAEPLVPHIWPTYRSFLENGLPAPVAAAVSDLLARSGDR